MPTLACIIIYPSSYLRVKEKDNQLRVNQEKHG